MLPQVFAAPRGDRQERQGIAPHRLAGSSEPASPRSPTARSPTASRLAVSSSNLGSPRHRATALPAYRSLLGRAAPPQRLPHCRTGGEERPVGPYTSLEHLRRLGEPHRLLLLSSQLPLVLLPSWQP